MVVPTYNESANVEGCLRALLASDPPCNHWQLVVADDDSSNDTVSKAEGGDRRDHARFDLEMHHWPRLDLAGTLAGLREPSGLFEPADDHRHQRQRTDEGDEQGDGHDEWGAEGECRLRSRWGSALLRHRRDRGETAITQQAGHREVAHRHAAVTLKQPFGHLHAQGIGLFEELQPLQIAQTTFDPLEGFSRELALGTTLAHGECRLVRES